MHSIPTPARSSGKSRCSGPGETTSDNRGCGQISPEIGITSTPVIDRNAGAHGTIYLVAMSKNGSTYFQRLHALDVTTGAELARRTRDDPGHLSRHRSEQLRRPSGLRSQAIQGTSGLLLLNGVIYTSWTSHCDIGPYTGWIIGYNESKLAQTSVLDLTPNGSEGSIWQSGGGLAADPQGNIYALIANGTFDTTLDVNGFPDQQDFGNAFVKISTSGGTSAGRGLFQHVNTLNESNGDVDLGSGGAMVLPDVIVWHGRHAASGGGRRERREYLCGGPQQHGQSST